jgi:cation diffusion facilitator CzcD-associated flavoprotein CzcO
MSEALRRRYAAERDKRLRADGNDQYQAPSGELSNQRTDPYVTRRLERPPLTDEVEVIVVGGGFGGLIVAAELTRAGIGRVRIVDQAGDVGGTWYWNRYPGVMCDIESMIYLPYLEELGRIPRYKYSPGSDIREHARAIARHFGLYRHACLQTKVTGVRWHADAARWVVTTDRGDTMRSQFIVLSLGSLSAPKLPAIPGLAGFTGHAFHSSRWDYEYTGGHARGGLVGLRDKRVAIVGTGATAVQCVPHLARWSEHLYVFQRTPSAVDVRANHRTSPDWWHGLEPGWQRRRIENFTAIITGADEDTDLVDDGWTRTYRALTGFAAKQAARRIGRRLTTAERDALLETADDRAMNAIRRRVDTIVRDEQTAESLKAWYRRFCKRPAFHDQYLASFNRPNVTLVDTDGRGVEGVSGRTIRAAGHGYEVDCLILATGFEVGTDYTRRAAFDVSGRDGRRLSDAWSAGMQTFHGLYSYGFPNSFFIGQTQTGFTVNYTHMILEQAEHLAYVLAEVRRRGAAVVEAELAAQDAWVEEVRRLSGPQLRYFADCTPSYFNSEGRTYDHKGLLTGSYGRGPVRFFDLLAGWRRTGDLAGLRLDGRYA